MRRRRLPAVVLPFLFSAAVALPEQERLVIVGAGFTGYETGWDTVLDLANPGSDEVWAWIGQIPRFAGCLHCPGWDVSVPRHGAKKTTAQEVLAFGSPGVRTLFVDPWEGSEQPTVSARVVNRARPSQTTDLPVVRYSTIQALNPTVLAFPLARRTADSHSNLVLAEVSRGTATDLSVLVEAYSAAGERLGSASFDIASGDTLFLMDVLSRLRSGELENGQIRVTKTGGNGLMWGLLATVSDDGRVSVSAGSNP